MPSSFLGLHNPIVKRLAFGSLTIAGAVGTAVTAPQPTDHLWLTVSSAVTLAVAGGVFAIDVYESLKPRRPTGHRPAVLPEPPPVPGWNVPPPTTGFSGRADVLRDLQRDFSRHRVVALTGIGGVGKTQLARRYAYDHRADYQHAFWVSAAARGGLVAWYREIARLLGLGLEEVADQEQIVLAARDALAGMDRWLLIFDNVEDPALVRAFLPEGTGGHALLTMQAPPPPEIAFGRRVEAMPETEGARLLLQRAGRLSDRQRWSDVPAEQRDEAEAFSRDVDGLPLALDQAGAYMARAGLTPGEYRKLYAVKGKRLRAARGREAEHVAVSTTFSLAFERVRRESGAAADLLCLCAFLDPDAIPEELFTRGLPDLPKRLRRAVADPFDWNTVIGAATRLALLQRDADERSLAIHRMVQAVLRDRMSARVRRHWAERAVRAVNRAFPDTEPANWPSCDRLISHALACTHWIEVESLVFAEAARLLNQAGYFLKRRGQYATAERLLQRALAIYEEARGPKHPATATSLNNLALLYQDQGKLTEAEPPFKRALAIREEVLGAKHPDTATSLNNLATLYRARGKLAEAEPLYQRALAIHEAVLGPQHPNTAASLNNLAGLYQAQGKRAEAEPLYQRALAIYEEALGPKHPATETVRENYESLRKKR